MLTYYYFIVHNDLKSLYKVNFVKLSVEDHHRLSQIIADYRRLSQIIADYQDATPKDTTPTP